MADSLLALGGLSSLTLSTLSLQSLALTACGSAPIGVTLQVVTPTFDPPADTYSVAQSVVISSATPGAIIYYTTDGSAPDVTSTPYTGPVNVAVSETLKAIAYHENLAVSAIGSAAYVIGAVPTFLTIVNAGFESDVLAPESQSNETFTDGWTGTPAGTPGNFWFGALHSDIGYTGVVAHEGVNEAILFSNTGNTVTSIQQTLANVWIASKTYTISFAIQYSKSVTSNPTSGKVQLLNGATVLFDSGIIVPAGGDYDTPRNVVLSFDYATPASGAMIGQPITIKFLTDPSDASSIILIDDVVGSFQ